MKIPCYRTPNITIPINKYNQKLTNKGDKNEKLCNIKLRYPRPIMTTKITHAQPKYHLNPDIINTMPYSLNPIKTNPKVVLNLQTIYGV